jgi:hypothetical protein
MLHSSSVFHVGWLLCARLDNSNLQKPNCNIIQFQFQFLFLFLVPSIRVPNSLATEPKASMLHTQKINAMPENMPRQSTSLREMDAYACNHPECRK